MNIEKPQLYYDYDALSFGLFTGKLTENDSIIISDITLRHYLFTHDGHSKILDKMEENGNLQVIFFHDHYLDNKIWNYKIDEYELDEKVKDLACAIYCDRYLYPDSIVYCTRDLSMKIMANLYFGEDSIKYR